MQLRIGKALLVSLFALLAGPIAARATEAVGAITWRTQWSEALFAQAAREHRFVLLDLHAVWCHWCHVMDEQTYTDPKVRDLIEQRYLAISIDADSDPDLTSRYGDWGWPATIVLASDGTEIVKRRGFMPAPQMASLLQAIIDDPTPGPSVSEAVPVARMNATGLAAHARATLLKTYDDLYDVQHGGDRKSVV
jgi:thiol:disulfide interchange protein